MKTLSKVEQHKGAKSLLIPIPAILVKETVLFPLVKGDVVYIEVIKNGVKVTKVTNYIGDKE